MDTSKPEKVLSELKEKVNIHYHLKSVQRYVPKGCFVLVMGYNDETHWTLDIFGGKGEITADGFETSDVANERESLEEGGFGCRGNIIVDRLGETIGIYRVEKSILNQRINMTQIVLPSY